MGKKKRVLIAFIGSGRDGGVDQYLLRLISDLNLDQYSIDFLTNSKNQDLSAWLEEKGMNLYEVHSSVAPVKQYKDIKQIMKKNKYDVFYLNISTAIPCAGMVAAKHTGIKNRIVHSHSSGLDNENKYVRFFMTFIHNVCKRILSKEALVYVACSEKAGEWLYTKKVMQSPDFFVLHNAVQTEKFVFQEDTRDKVREQYGVQDKKVIIQVANFSYPKNHEFTLRVFKRILEQNSKYVLWLIGSGEKEDKIKELAKVYGIEKHIVFYGQVSNVADYLQASDCFILPSWFEGYPISALEAQVNGLPCLMSCNVTKESKIIPNCKFLPLDERIWEKELLKITEKDRETKVFQGKKSIDLCNQVVELWNKG